MDVRKWVLFAAVAGCALGNQLGEWRSRSERVTIRRELAQAVAANQELRDACFTDMKNQFTPGYKSAAPLVRMEDGSSILSMAQGEVFRTQTPTNLAMWGTGFFVTGDAAAPSFTRDGRFLWKDGVFSTQDGRPVLGYGSGKRLAPIRLDLASFSGYHFDESGTLYGEETLCDPVTGQTATTQKPLGRVALAWFDNPTLLRRTRDTAFEPTAASGPAHLATIGDKSLGRLCPGSLELSNVDFMEQGLAVQALKTQAQILGPTPTSSADAGRPIQPMSNLNWAAEPPPLGPPPPPLQACSPCPPPPPGILGNGGRSHPFGILGNNPRTTTRPGSMQKALAAGADPLQIGPDPTR